MTSTLATLLKLIAITNVMVVTAIKKEDLRDEASMGSHELVDFCSIRTTAMVTLIKSPRQNKRSKESAAIRRISKPSKLRINTPTAVSKIPLIYSDMKHIPFYSCTKNPANAGLLYVWLTT
jgi:hypothetical protein